MPLDEFTEQAFDGLCSGEDTTIIGGVEPRATYLEIVNKRREMTESLAATMRKYMPTS